MSLARRRMMLYRMQAPADDNFTELEYLTCDGSQYIDTGVAAGSRISYEIKIQTSETEYMDVLGCSGNDSFYYLATAQKICAGYGAATVTTTTYTQFTDDVYSFKNNILYRDGNRVHIFNGAEFNINNTITLFAFNGDGAVRDDMRFKGKFYYLKIWNNGEPVRDYISVTINGITCLYDKLCRKFYYNQGTDSFIAGPAI